MESRVEKYRKVQSEIARLTTLLTTQTWMSPDQAHREAIRIEAKTRRECALAQMDYDWYSWLHKGNELPEEKPEGTEPGFWF